MATKYLVTFDLENGSNYEQIYEWAHRIGG
jgi:hypothetical protein